jgi:hypothetical protein
VFTGARLGSVKARRAKVGVTQNWVNDELYEDARVAGESSFYNYRRRILKRRHAMTNACHLLLEGGDAH